MNRCLSLCVAAALNCVSVAIAAAEPPPMPGIEVDDDDGSCTAGFAAQGADGGYYLLTSGHCDEHDGAQWTYGSGSPLGRVAASEVEGDQLDAAIIRLDPGVGPPAGALGGRYPVSGALDATQLRPGMTMCKIGAVTGETCGVITDVDGNLVEASVFSLAGDSGSPGFVVNPDGTAGAVGLLAGSPEGDDYTTYFILVAPALSKWGLRLLP